MQTYLSRACYVSQRPKKQPLITEQNNTHTVFKQQWRKEVETTEATTQAAETGNNSNNSSCSSCSSNSSNWDTSCCSFFKPRWLPSTVEATAYSYNEAGLSNPQLMEQTFVSEPNVIMVDPSVIPLGSYVEIPGYGISPKGRYRWR